MLLKEYPFSKNGVVEFSGVPEGADALMLAELAARLAAGEGGAARNLLYVASDESAMMRLADALAFFMPEFSVVTLPAWDCLPYDRVPPRHDVMARRLSALAAITGAAAGSSFVVITTVAAALQKLPPPGVIRQVRYAARVGDSIDNDALLRFLGENGYQRAETVREPGEYAIRGGIVDIFPPGTDEPVRLDLFGDVLEGVRGFDPVSQLSSGPRPGIDLLPASEIILSEDAIARFRAGYRSKFGAVRGNDPLYEAVSNGVRHPGMEHWLPLFYPELATIFDYVTGPVVLGLQSGEAAEARLELIADYFDARVQYNAARQKNGGDDDDAVYHPLPVNALYLDSAAWTETLARRPHAVMETFHKPEAPGVIAVNGRRAHDFSEARSRPDTNLFDSLRQRIANDRAAGQGVAIAAYSQGARERMIQLMHDHDIDAAIAADDWQSVLAQARSGLPVFVLGIDHGYTVDGLTLYSEQDILGDRLARRRQRPRRAEDFISEVSTLSLSDLVVHVDHGIARYDGLTTLEIGGAPHDCLRLVYAGDDKLFLPVENLELLSRYGSEDAGAQLDRLGGASWQARRARVKERITEIADELLRIAAARQLRQAPRLTPPPGLYEEFCARFPFDETDDQSRAITESLDSLAGGQPMDRLVCGDVGFGKTEVALRAAFVAAMNGKQVAVVVPTTLLARQHYATFKARFAGYPVEIAQLSRLVGTGEARAVREGLTSGKIDIVIGTHALLGKSIAFSDLGLLVVDEEQRFGVGQKERLKQLRADVHVLTLTATPIPRTLQLALAGVRELSLIATPPVDRMAVRTFILPYDPVTVREAIMREHFRGGQSFYVCPRIEDLPRLETRLRDLVPEVRFAVAHGQMAPTALEEVMTDFYEGKFEVLLCTNIVESGLDLPTANTIIIHRADRFGLAQLYQLRGRVGRSKVRAYAYLTLPAGQTLTETARKRLDVMQTLDSLGAGFSLASHDLDIRGAGNLLGEEQSGHIREVGVELYQHMLEEAVATAREIGSGGTAHETPEWTPTITLGTPVLIPENYVTDLGVRLGLYRRMAALVDAADIDAFAAELIDRFGKLPAEVENLFDVVTLKRLCRDAGVEKLDAGPKGAVVSFRDNSYANPAGLVDFITGQAGMVKLRPDHKLVYQRDWADDRQRLTGARRLMIQLAELAGDSAAAAQ